MRKRTLVCIRRILYLLALLIEAACVLKCPELLLHNAIYGWKLLPQLAEVAGLAGTMMLLCNWLLWFEG